MENRLISMVNFVLNNHKIWYNGGNLKPQKLQRIIVNYANFLSKPLQKWMFVPCGEDGNLLSEPKDYADILEQGSRVYHYDNIIEARKYQQAKERCLFYGFEFSRETANYVFFIRDGIYTQLIPKAYTETIEDLTKHNLILTATAQKQIEG